jgi:hypothetical protein
MDDILGRYRLAEGGKSVFVLREFCFKVVLASWLTSLVKFSRGR